jgi:hypothetical protein
MAINSATNGSNTPYDPTQDPLYQQMESQQTQVYNDHLDTLNDAQSALSDYQASHPIQLNMQGMPQMLNGGAYDPSLAQDPAKVAQLKAAVTAAQVQVTADNLGKQGVESHILSVVQTTHDGQEMVADAQQAGQSARVDLSRMALGDMVMAIMGACNNSTDDIAQMIAAQLQSDNAKIAEMNSLMQRINSYTPATDGSSNPDLTMPTTLLTQINQDGVDLPKDTTDNGDGTSKMKSSDLQTLIENIKTQIETMNNNQTAQLQALNKANNNHNERSDMISHVLDTQHETDSNALR